MSIFDTVLQGAPKLGAVAEGEYQLQVIKFFDSEEKTNKNGEKYDFQTMVCLVVGEPTAEDIRIPLFSPIKVANPDEAQQKAIVRTQNRLIDMFEAFGFTVREPGTPMPTQDAMVGAVANAHLGIKTDEYGTQNTVNKWASGQ